MGGYSAPHNSVVPQVTQRFSLDDLLHHMLGTQGSSSSVISVTVGVVRYTDSKNPTTKTSTSITPVIGGPEDFGRRAVGNGSCPAVKGVLGHVSERSFPASELLVALRQQRPLVGGTLKFMVLCAIRQDVQSNKKSRS